MRSRGLLYRCFRTRREVAEAIASAPHSDDRMDPPFAGGPLSEDEAAARLAAGEPFAWRLSLARALAALENRELGFQEQGRGPRGQHGWAAADPRDHGDVVLARKDVGVAYHLAVVVDDALQGITHVVRGEDLFDATAIQVLLQALLGAPTPVYRHHRLLLGADGRRLAKRDGAPSLAALRAEGATPMDVRRTLGLAD